MVVAALAFLVWDILITTDEEVTLFSGLIPVALEADLVYEKVKFVWPYVLFLLSTEDISL